MDHDSRLEVELVEHLGISKLLASDQEWLEFNSLMVIFAFKRMKDAGVFACRLLPPWSHAETAICIFDSELPGKFPLGTSMAEHIGPVELNSSNHLIGGAKRLDLIVYCKRYRTSYPNRMKAPLGKTPRILAVTYIRRRSWKSILYKEMYLLVLALRSAPLLGSSLLDSVR